MTVAMLKPRTVDEAVAMLAADEGARPLSGGATLVAMRNAGLVDVSAFVSLGGIPDLAGISRQENGAIRIGGMTRHRDTAVSDLLTGDLEVVRMAASMIANRPVRNMGTIGGAVANADPAADYLPALFVCDAVLHVAGPGGTRAIAIADFTIDWYETALEQGEIITAVELPAARPLASHYRKVARVSGDFATCSCAIALDDDGQGFTMRIAIGACGPHPLRDRDAEETLRGRLHDDGAISEVIDAIVGLADPIDDVRGSAAYRLELIPRLIRAGRAQLLNRTEAAQ